MFEICIGIGGIETYKGIGRSFVITRRRRTVSGRARRRVLVDNTSFVSSQSLWNYSSNLLMIEEEMAELSLS